MLLTLAGGIGLFLLGMILLTDGLKNLAGDTLRLLLSRFVKGPFSALGSGTLVTFLVQSSSATTLATIGFVSAGLISFPQTIGVLLGAKLGTTSTGWIVATLGLRYSVSVIALPIIGVGAIMKLLSSGKIAHAGLALAGFGLIFMGIDTLQVGMEGLRDYIDFTVFSGSTFKGIWLLIIIGIVMTVIMQSSSAAVATTLTALFAGAIDLPQAAALVIGQNFGTSITALIAIIGASVAAIRTGVIYVLFGLVIAIIAIAVMPVFLWTSGYLQILNDPAQMAIAVAAFHTSFNLLGIMIIMPFRMFFTNIVMKWFPEDEFSMTHRLDNSVQQIPSVAVETVNRSLQDMLSGLLEYLSKALGDSNLSVDRNFLNQAELAKVEISQFLNEIKIGSEQKPDYNRYVATLHALDHNVRILDACRDTHFIKNIPDDPVATQMSVMLQMSFDKTQKWIADQEEKKVAEHLCEVSVKLADLRKKRRVEVLEQAANTKVSSIQILANLDTIRWLDKLAYHHWRAVYHLMDKKEYEIDPPYPG
ncbi:Na/Pi cotransporter family protein [Gracilimonas sp. Q87]|uniref:Na/Pi cotransporter family protein n=1 Tax=Gracilimonas sp. Q87 TaxID=3384766 RepID=UPI00398427D2